MTGGWEFYWRGKGLTAGDFKNTASLWAEARRKATGDATVIIGSSRIFFDIDLDIWEEISGVRPVQLALEGTSPRIFLKDLANDEAFRGKVIVGVTRAAFLHDRRRAARERSLTTSKTKPSRNAPIICCQSLLNERSPSSTSSRGQSARFISGQRPCAKVCSRSLIRGNLKSLKEDRNAKLWSRVVTDEAYREEAKAQWLIGLKLFAPPPGPNGEPPKQMPDEAINAVIAEVQANIDKIRARGGDVAFMRLPYDGAFAVAEDNGFPRERFWDRLVAQTNSVGVAWQDYPELNGHYIPEWSHLAAEDSRNYTRAVTPIFYEKTGWPTKAKG